MHRCVTIDQPMLEKTKLDKVLPRLVKRGDDQGRTFAQKILDNAAAISKQKITGGKAVQNQQPNGSAPRSPVENKEVKREQLDEGKKAPSVVSKASSLLKTAKSANGPENRPPSVKIDGKSNVKIGGADASATKIKTNHVTAKPSGFFAGLKSASKKPGTSAKTEDAKAK